MGEGSEDSAFSPAIDPVTHVTGVRTIGVTRARERWICKYVSHPSQRLYDMAKSSKNFLAEPCSFLCVIFSARPRTNYVPTSTQMGVK